MDIIEIFKGYSMVRRVKKNKNSSLINHFATSLANGATSIAESASNVAHRPKKEKTTQHDHTEIHQESAATSAVTEEDISITRPRTTSISSPAALEIIAQSQEIKSPLVNIRSNTDITTDDTIPKQSDGFFMRANEAIKDMLFLPVNVVKLVSLTLKADQSKETKQKIYSKKDKIYNAALTIFAPLVTLYTGIKYAAGVRGAKEAFDKSLPRLAAFSFIPVVAKLVTIVKSKLKVGSPARIAPAPISPIVNEVPTPQVNSITKQSRVSISSALKKASNIILKHSIHKVAPHNSRALSTDKHRT